MNKTEFVLKHSKSTVGEIVSLAAAQGIDLSKSHVHTIRYKARKDGKLAHYQATGKVSTGKATSHPATVKAKVLKPKTITVEARMLALVWDVGGFEEAEKLLRSLRNKNLLQVLS